MTPESFCQHVIAEYEQQWAAAVGHQERHPLQVKIDLLRKLTDRARDADEFGRLLADGCASEDPFQNLLCSELLPLWQRYYTRK